MKKINKYVLGAAAFCMTSLTGCIEETQPTDIATEEQVAKSASATEAMTLGLPSRLNLLWNEDDGHCYFGYPAEMIVRDMMTGDYMHAGETGYSHFISWARNKNMGDSWLKTQFHWNYYYGSVMTANGVIGAVDESVATPDQLAYKGVGLAYRALFYLDLARMYEFLPNDKFTTNADKVDVTNKTVPIVTDVTSAEEAANNPRASRDSMAVFIENDLNDAERLIVNLENTSGNTLPDLACVYGLKARLYMWLEDYAKAQEYARKAIDASTVSPISQSEALDLKKGYNTATDFMWAGKQTSEDRSVTSGIINWTSWVSNQTTFGYTGTSTALYTYIDKRMYERIGDTDWRKLQWVAPDGSALKEQNKFITKDDAENIPAYASLKFRPAEGEVDEYSTGASSAYPVMRVEEMYFIEAEAAEHVAAGTGVELLQKFMTSYRDPKYTFSGSDAIDEIVFQKRVELWGEGQTFFDIKRLNMSVTRGYAGTNWQDVQCRLNTNGRPAWMNFVMVRSEANNNKALVANNNPDPTDCYDPWTE